MTCTEEYKEHIVYTFHAFCRVVIRNAMYTAVRTRNRKYKREISLDYLTDEKHYPFGTKDEYFKAPEPEEEYLLTICGDTVVFSNAPLPKPSPACPNRSGKCCTCPFSSVCRSMKSPDATSAAAAQRATISAEP